MPNLMNKKVELPLNLEVQINNDYVIFMKSISKYYRRRTFTKNVSLFI